MLQYLGQRWMYRLRYLLEEEAVAKVERKRPESDRQAFETVAVSKVISYRPPFVIQIPCM